MEQNPGKILWAIMERTHHMKIYSPTAPCRGLKSMLFKGRSPRRGASALSAQNERPRGESAKALEWHLGLPREAKKAVCESWKPLGTKKWGSDGQGAGQMMTSRDAD
jgi:hypothetical protein